MEQLASPTAAARAASAAAVAAATGDRAATPVAGQLTNGWRLFTGIGWALVIVAYAAVWKTSYELGLSTWWLGPFGDPQPAFVTMLPFVAPLVMVLLALNNSRWLPWAGLVGGGRPRHHRRSTSSRVPVWRSSNWRSPAPAHTDAVAGLRRALPERDADQPLLRSA